MKMTDQEFMTQFEGLTLHPQHFNHRGHLRLAWLYLMQYPLEVAIEKTAVGIQAYATHLGATGKYHHTLTVAIVRLMNGRIQKSRHTSFAQFLDENPDLLNNLPQLLQQHYSQDLLYSERAKSVYVEPDLLPFTEFDMA